MKNNDYNWNEFDPYNYLSVNYVKILPPDREILKYLVELYVSFNPRGKFLEVCCGPNLYPVFAMLPFAGSIDIVEFGARNVEYLRRQKIVLDGVWSQWQKLLCRLHSVYNKVVE